MKHYTDTIPLELAEKLKSAGMSMQDAYTPILYDKPESVMSGCIIPTYAEVFDWLMERGVDMELSTRAFFLVWDKDGDPLAIKGKTWHEAANKAIEKALELI